MSELLNIKNKQQRKIASAIRNLYLLELIIINDKNIDTRLISGKNEIMSEDFLNDIFVEKAVLQFELILKIIISSKKEYNSHCISDLKQYVEKNFSNDSHVNLILKKIPEISKEFKMEHMKYLDNKKYVVLPNNEMVFDDLVFATNLALEYVGGCRYNSLTRGTK